MSKLETMTETFEISAPARNIWATISDFHQLGRWMPVVARSRPEVSGNEAGAMRTCLTADGVEMLDRLEEVDAGKMSLTYAILEATPAMPFRGYRATMSLTEVGPGKSELVWSCSFLTRGDASAADIKAYVKGIYKVGVDGLKMLHAAK